MDYQFIKNEYDEPEAVFSSGHEALGYYLTSELANQTSKIEDIQKAIGQIQSRKIQNFVSTGKAYILRIEDDDVRVSAVALEYDFDEELPESTELYDGEQTCECGLLDFSLVLEQWQIFCA